jgi:prevent-host-death family protein
VITATEAARRMSDLLNRVRYRNESFIIIRGGEEIARLIGIADQPPITLSEAVSAAAAHRTADPSFAGDLESIQRQQSPPGDDPWAS